MIKKLFSVLLFMCLFQSVVYSYTLKVTEWDQTEDTQLYKKLDESYWKSHYIDEHTINGGPNAYYKEVLEPYELNKKKWSEVPKKYYKIETK